MSQLLELLQTQQLHNATLQQTVALMAQQLMAGPEPKAAPVPEALPPPMQLPPEAAARPEQQPAASPAVASPAVASPAAASPAAASQAESLAEPALTSAAPPDVQAMVEQQPGASSEGAGQDSAPVAPLGLVSQGAGAGGWEEVTQLNARLISLLRARGEDVPPSLLLTTSALPAQQVAEAGGTAAAVVGEPALPLPASPPMPPTQRPPTLPPPVSLGEATAAMRALPQLNFDSYVPAASGPVPELTAAPRSAVRAPRAARSSDQAARAQPEPGVRPRGRATPRQPATTRPAQQPREAQRRSDRPASDALTLSIQGASR
jgi:DNA polymerase-3 subunit gamma/tau